MSTVIIVDNVPGRRLVLGFFLTIALGCALEWEREDVFDTSLDVAPDIASEADSVSDAICPYGQGLCDGECVNLSANHRHCGRCENECEPTEVCDNGNCLLDCPPGKTNCDGSCVVLNEDILNCGQCGLVCSAGANAEPMCIAGSCIVRCLSGWSDMDGDGSCETNCVPSPGGKYATGRTTTAMA